MSKVINKFIRLAKIMFYKENEYSFREVTMTIHHRIVRIEFSSEETAQKWFDDFIIIAEKLRDRDGINNV